MMDLDLDFVILILIVCIVLYIVSRRYKNTSGGGYYGGYYGGVMQPPDENGEGNQENKQENKQEGRQGLLDHFLEPQGEPPADEDELLPPDPPQLVRQPNYWVPPPPLVSREGENHNQ